MSVWDSAEVLQHGEYADEGFWIAAGRYSEPHDGNHYYEYEISRDEAVQLRDELDAWIAATQHTEGESE
jgi:hypothetical protein